MLASVPPAELAELAPDHEAMVMLIGYPTVFDLGVPVLRQNGFAAGPSPQEL